MGAPFFAHYDANGDGEIDFEEFRLIFRDLNEHLSREAQLALFQASDSDRSGSISFEEFVACLLSFALSPEGEHCAEPASRVNVARYLSGDGDVADEEEDLPRDLVKLEPELQQTLLRRRALVKIGLGLALVSPSPALWWAFWWSWHRVSASRPSTSHLSWRRCLPMPRLS